jgi:hypothetical protein
MNLDRVHDPVGYAEAMIRRSKLAQQKVLTSILAAMNKGKVDLAKKLIEQEIY